jgi:DNA-binding NarL/FixJ family response regulator
VPVLVISIYSEDQYAVRLIKAGASGYLTKGCAPAIVIEAVSQIAGGKKYISPTVAEMLANEFDTEYGKFPHEILSDREYQIFLMLASAKTISEIAETLALSGKTVSTYRNRILQKMHLRNNAEMMRYATDNNLIQAT